MAIKRSELQQNIGRAVKAQIQKTHASDPSPFSRAEPEATPPLPAKPNPTQIAEAAYYRAMARGFEAGQEMDDWLAAERELEGRTAQGNN